MRSVVREYGISTADIAPEEVIRIAKNKGFKVKRKKMKLEDISAKYPMPAILQMKDDSYIILLAIKHDEGKVLTLVPLAKHPVSHDFDELQEQIKDEIIILRHKNADSDVKFGFKWFFNEIFKYKKIIGQVLLGSFVVQLFGLVTPLFTQVILDKVLVKRTIATLDVLAVAFVVVAVFDIDVLECRCRGLFHLDVQVDHGHIRRGDTCRQGDRDLDIGIGTGVGEVIGDRQFLNGVEDGFRRVDGSGVVIIGDRIDGEAVCRLACDIQIDRHRLGRRCQSDLGRDRVRDDLGIDDVAVAVIRH
jgi:hypothetical protein